MPNIKSAVKKVRKDKRRTAVNLRWRRRVKAAVKAARDNPSPDSLIRAQKELDKAAQKGIVKKKKSARLKSRLSKAVHAD